MSAYNLGELGLIPELGRFPGEGKGYPIQYSGLENSMDSPLGHKESDTTERLSLSAWNGGFPDSSVGKESTCNAGDPGLIPGLGRSTGEGVGYLLQHSWVSLVVQLVNNLSAMQETLVRFLSWEDPLEKG